MGLKKKICMYMTLLTCFELLPTRHDCRYKRGVHDLLMASPTSSHRNQVHLSILNYRRTSTGFVRHRLHQCTYCAKFYCVLHLSIPWTLLYIRSLSLVPKSRRSACASTIIDQGFKLQTQVQAAFGVFYWLHLPMYTHSIHMSLFSLANAVYLQFYCLFLFSFCLPFLLLFFFLFQSTLRYELKGWIGIWCPIQPDVFGAFKLPD
jgi:hypothetical protein